jgi:hypothetical protein
MDYESWGFNPMYMSANRGGDFADNNQHVGVIHHLGEWNIISLLCTGPFLMMLLRMKVFVSVLS